MLKMHDQRDGKSLGCLLRAHRVAQGLTQVALAERAGCSAEMLRKFEADAKRPSRQAVERLAVALRLSADEREQLLALLPVSKRCLSGAPAPASPWFPHTKLHTPRPRADVLARQRLIEPIRRALGAVRLALLSAPAGAGKTTLLASLAAVHRAAGGHVAWVTLDEEDNDPNRFLAVLGATCEALAPGAGAAIKPLLIACGPDQGDRTSWVRQTLTTLINRLLDGPRDPAMLVLDNLHTLTEPPVVAALAFLLDQLPGHITLAVAARHDPPLALTQLRARRELLEVRLPELRFTADEAGSLLDETLRLGLPDTVLDTLCRRAEGWAAGLCLLTARLAGLPQPLDPFCLGAALAQGERDVSAYLTDEVLNREPPAMRTFLMETSPLTMLTTAACRALTGRGDSGALLDDLARRNLVLGAPTNRVSDVAIYRYHGLFRDVLQAQLQHEAPQRWEALCGRAVAIAQEQATASDVPIVDAGASKGVLTAGGEALSPREIEVLRQLAQGARNAAIAERLLISPHTVKHHVSSVLGKLGATTRTEASRLAYELGVARR